MNQAAVELGKNPRTGYQCLPATVPKPDTPQTAAASASGGGFGGAQLELGGAGSDLSSLRLMSDVLLGEILIERGIISKQQLEHGLSTQRATGMRIGEALVNHGFCGWDQVEMGIRIQGQRRRYLEEGK